MKVPEYEIDATILEQEPVKAASAIVAHYKNQKAKYIKKSDIAVYADKLVELAATIKSKPIDCFVCPLRGALKPVTYLRTMDALGKHIEWLPFTTASSGEHDPELIHYLKTIIHRNLPRNSPTFSMGVIDTAIGGHGINKLTNLLLRCRLSYPMTTEWLIHYFIIHPPNVNARSIDSVKSAHDRGLTFLVDRCEVNDLLVEDWDAALGIEVEYCGDSIQVKNSVTEGRLILSADDSILVVDSPEMSNYVDALIAQVISDAITTHPHLRFVKNVWPGYIFR